MVTASDSAAEGANRQQGIHYRPFVSQSQFNFPTQPAWPVSALAEFDVLNRRKDWQRRAI
jgi:hypothetical protein